MSDILINSLQIINSPQIKLEWNKPKISSLGNLKDFVQMGGKSGTAGDDDNGNGSEGFGEPDP